MRRKKIYSARRPDPIIKKKLVLAGIKVIEFAHELNIAYPMASYICNGWHVPADPQLRMAIARYLDCSEDELFPQLKERC